MKLIITLMLLATITLAQWGPGGVPTDWRGLGLEWMESSKFTSASATNYLSFAGDSTFITLTGVTGNRDNALIFCDEDGACMKIIADDGIDGFHFDVVRFRVGANLDNSVQISCNGTAAYIETLGAATELILIPDSGDDGGQVTVGYANQENIFYCNSMFRGAFVSVSAAYTLGTDECVYCEQTANETVNLPATPVLGDTFQVKFTHASGGTLNGNGNNIDGNATISASEDDAYLVVYNGTEWGIW